MKDYAVYYAMYALVWLKTKYLRTREKLYTIHRDFPVYVRTIRLNPAFPRMDTAPCQETDYPYRSGTAIMYRIAGSFGVTVAILNSHPDLTDKAINGRLIDAMKSADGTREYWDTPERRAAAVSIPEEALITPEDTVEPTAP